MQGIDEVSTCSHRLQNTLQKWDFTNTGFESNQKSPNPTLKFAETGYQQ